jgi:hypothetical protein
MKKPIFKLQKPNKTKYLKRIERVNLVEELFPDQSELDKDEVVTKTLKDLLNLIPAHVKYEDVEISTYETECDGDMLEINYKIEIEDNSEQYKIDLENYKKEYAKHLKDLETYDKFKAEEKIAKLKNQLKELEND